MNEKSLLRLGVIAGPFYVLVSLAQALTRDGFDLTRHAWSLLSNGELGWIQITNFVLTGLMVIAAATGLRRALAPGRGRVWGPWLIGVYGASLIGAGIFTADPAQGFPAGTPQETTTISWHGMLHFMVGGVGFLCLIAACFLIGSRFALDTAWRPQEEVTHTVTQGTSRQHRGETAAAIRHSNRGLAWFSRLTGVAFFAAFAGIASGSQGPVTLAFVAAVLLVWTWLATICIHFSTTS